VYIDFYSHRDINDFVWGDKEENIEGLKSFLEKFECEKFDEHK